MNNSHMLSIIEKKMCANDRKVWSRDLEREKQPATLHRLMSWMTVEMKSRMRAIIAPVRNGSTNRRNVDIVGGKVDDEVKNWHKCWHCSDSSHWPDQSQKHSAMNYGDRVKAAKANHVCFRCLKKAGREHKMANCKRKRQCTKSENGIQCTSFHHPLLHKSNNVNIGVASLSKSHESILPVLKMSKNELMCFSPPEHKSASSVNKPQTALDIKERTFPLPLQKLGEKKKK